MKRNINELPNEQQIALDTFIQRRNDLSNRIKKMSEDLSLLNDTISKYMNRLGLTAVIQDGIGTLSILPKSASFSSKRAMEQLVLKGVDPSIVKSAFDAATKPGEGQYLRFFPAKE